jgi:hypothetical protein
LGLLLALVGGIDLHAPRLHNDATANDASVVVHLAARHAGAAAHLEASGETADGRCAACTLARRRARLMAITAVPLPAPAGPGAWSEVTAAAPRTDRLEAPSPRGPPAA